jgi:hypothetical protein
VRGLRRAGAVLLCFALPACGARQAEPPDHDVGEQSTLTIPQLRGAGVYESTATTPDAIAAVVRFVCSGQRLLDTPPTQLPEVIRGLWSSRAADSAVTTTVEQLAELRDRLDSGRGATRYRQSVMAVRVESASAARVEVSAWWVGVLSREGAVLPQAQWTTSLVTVIREDGGWHVDEESSEPGPVPDSTSDSEPISHEDFERRLAGFVDWEATQ